MYFCFVLIVGLGSIQSICDNDEKAEKICDFDITLWVETPEKETGSPKRAVPFPETYN